jgi:predicted transcriptional regulator of viral defense system
MEQTEAIKVLKYWGNKGFYVFTKHELAKLFPGDSPKTFSESLARLVKTGIVQRACRGIYINKDALLPDGYTIERITIALRRGEYNYVSLESMLSEYGSISQIPIDRLTVMTTGRSGVYRTAYGVIEFTHTQRSILNIIDSTNVVSTRPLRIATKQTAWRDLKRIGRNVNMVTDKELLND